MAIESAQPNQPEVRNDGDHNGFNPSDPDEYADGEEEGEGDEFWTNKRILLLLECYRPYRKQMMSGRRKKMAVWHDVISSFFST